VNGTIRQLMVRPRSPRSSTRLLPSLGAAAISVLLSWIGSTFQAGDGLTAEYFANTTWTSPPAISGVDAELSAARMSERWNGNPPQEFSVRWTGFLTVGDPGVYTFRLASDDGSQLFVDNRLVVDNGGMHSLAARTGSVELQRGPHVVRVQYVQFGAASDLEWSWGLGNDGLSHVPGWILSRRPASYASVVNARLIRWAALTCALAAALSGAWWLYGILTTEEARRLIAAVRAAAVEPYRDTAAFLWSLGVCAAILWMPWPEGGLDTHFFRGIELTVTDLHRTTALMLSRRDAFQSDLETPGSGDFVLPDRVREVSAMLARHDIQRFRISDTIAGNAWVLQQTVATAWPRRLEPNADALFVLNDEPIPSSCSLVESRTEVSLVHCR
jgi:PA14 domain-containing protein